VSPERYSHTLGVVDVCGELARVHGADRRQARLAGLIHDCARDMPPRELLQRATTLGVSPSPLERAQPVLLHGLVGAGVAAAEVGIVDPELLQAVRRHVTGTRGMTLLDKIIFLADFIEPGRSFSETARPRSLARVDLDRAVLAAMDGIFSHLVAASMPLHPDGVAARNELWLRCGDWEGKAWQ